MKKIVLIGSFIAASILRAQDSEHSPLIPVSLSYSSIFKHNLHEIGLDFPVKAGGGFYFTPGLSVIYINDKFQDQDKKGIISFNFKPTFYSDVNDFIKLFFQINPHIGFFKGNENKNIVLSSGIGINSGLQINRISFSLGYRYVHQYANSDSSKSIDGLHVGLGYVLF